MLVQKLQVSVSLSLCKLCTDKIRQSLLVFGIGVAFIRNDCSVGRKNPTELVSKKFSDGISLFSDGWLKKWGGVTPPTPPLW